MKRGPEQQHSQQVHQVVGGSRRKAEAPDESDLDEKDETKRKSRNLSEKKRRDQFNVLINELCSMVSTTSRKMDKSTVLRSTIAFLRHHNDMSVRSQAQEGQDSWKPSFLSNEEFTHLMLESLDGFILILSLNGQILYTSESVASLLGYLPHDLHNAFILDFLHVNDQAAMCELLAPTLPDCTKPTGDFYVCLDVYMKRGSIGSSDSTSYELVNIKGTFFTVNCDGGSLSNPEYDSQSCSSVCSPGPGAGSVETVPCFVATVRLRTPQLLRELILCDGSKNEFTSRHSLEWKFLFLDHRAPPIIGYLPFELLGTSGYDYYHVDDLEKVAAGQEALMQTGEGTSCQYRFLTKGQQWIWLQTRYYITYHQWSSKPEFVMCTHRVISYDEEWSGSKSGDGRTSSTQAALTHAQYHSSRVSSIPSVSSRDESLSPNPSEKSASTGPCAPMAIGKRKQEERGNVTSHLSLPFTEACSITKNSPSLSHNMPLAPPSSSFIEPSRPPIQHQQQQPPVQHHSAPVMTSRSADITMEPVPFSAAPCHAPLITLTTLQPVTATFSPTSSMVHGAPSTAQMMQTAPRVPSTAMVPTSVDLSEPGHFQDYLRRRHQMLQQQILKQQEELKRVSEQLMLVHFINPTLGAVTATPAPLYTLSVPTSTVARTGGQSEGAQPQGTSHLFATSQQAPTAASQNNAGQQSTRMAAMPSAPMTPVYPLQLPQDQMIFTPSFNTGSDFFFGNNSGNCQ